MIMFEKILSRIIIIEKSWPSQIQLEPAVHGCLHRMAYVECLLQSEAIASCS